MVIAISWEDEKTRVVFYEGYAGDKSHMEIFGMGDSLALGKKKKNPKRKMREGLVALRRYFGVFIKNTKSSGCGGSRL